MGIFGNNKTTSDIDASTFDNTASSTDFKQTNTNTSINTRQQIKSPKYGIDQATTLVRSFQKHNVSSNVIANIMKQTLESVDIHFDDIINDAKRKESAVQLESEQKDQQIEEATRKCEMLKEEKTKLQQILKETITVREFLLEAMDSGASDNEPAQHNVAQFEERRPQKPTETQEILPVSAE